MTGDAAPDAPDFARLYADPGSPLSPRMASRLVEQSTRVYLNNRRPGVLNRRVGQALRSRKRGLSPCRGGLTARGPVLRSGQP
jgi:hypothetical protein